MKWGATYLYCTPEKTVFLQVEEELYISVDQFIRLFEICMCRKSSPRA